MRYLQILATVFAVLVLGLGVAGFVIVHSEVQHVARRIEQLQTDTNDNLCNQSAYSPGIGTCHGGDANGGSIGGLP